MIKSQCTSRLYSMLAYSYIQLCSQGSTSPAGACTKRAESSEHAIQVLTELLKRKLEFSAHRYGARIQQHK